MARNLAQIVILLYGLWLLFVSHRTLLLLAGKKLTAPEMRFLQKGAGNRWLLVSAKGKIPAFLFWNNVVSLLLLALCAVLQILLGWFGFFALPMKILKSLTIFSIGLEASVLSPVGNALRYGKPFLLYKSLPNETRVFASTLADVIVYCLLPVLMVFCNFFML